MKSIHPQQEYKYSQSEESIISFENLSFDLIKMRKINNKQSNQRSILKNISGHFNKGLNAIFGQSGAGKTSLLNILAKKIESNSEVELSGKILVNNHEYSSKDFGKFAGYVMQDDLLLANITVREYIQFAADLRLDMEKEKRVEKASKIIKLLQLERCQNSLIGDHETKSISGGERKRVSIGLELIGEPSVLFLDEPTSGLDSFTSYIVMQILKDIAEKQNSTIIFTIHQPSYDIWNLFDRVFFLLEGQFIYQGQRENVVDYFASMGFQCPIYSNPPDYIMSIVANQSKKYEYMWQSSKQLYAKQEKQDEQFHKRQPSLPYFQTTNEIKTVNAITTEFDVEQQINSKKEFNMPRNHVKKGLFQMVKILIGRQVLNLKRHKLMMRARFGQTIIIGLYLALLNLNLNNDYDNYRAIIQRAVILFVFSVGIFNQSLNPQVISFVQERPVFLKEQSAGMYSTSSYYISKVLPETVSCTIFAIIYSLILYWAIGLRNESSAVIFFIFVLIILSNVGNTLGLLIGSIFKSEKLSITFISVFLVPIFLFSGIFKNRADYANWVGWIQYLNPVFYSFTALTESQFSGLPYEYSPIDIFYLDFGKWESIGMLFVLYFAFHIIAFLCLKRHTKNIQ